jgi:hypothetical protein
MYAVPMMERELSRVVTYELGIVGKAFAITCDGKVPESKFAEIVQRILTKFQTEEEPFGAQSLLEVRFLGSVLASVRKHARS